MAGAPLEAEEERPVRSSDELRRMGELVASSASTSGRGQEAWSPLEVPGTAMTRDDSHDKEKTVIENLGGEERRNSASDGPRTPSDDGESRDLIQEKHSNQHGSRGVNDSALTDTNTNSGSTEERHSSAATTTPPTARAAGATPTALSPESFSGAGEMGLQGGEQVPLQGNSEPGPPEGVAIETIEDASTQGDEAHPPPVTTASQLKRSVSTRIKGEKNLARLTSMNKGVVGRAVAGYQATAGESPGSRFATAVRWAFRANHNVVKTNQRIFELEGAYQTGHKQSGAARVHKSGYHNAIYTGDHQALQGGPRRSSVTHARRSAGGHSDGGSSVHRGQSDMDSQRYYPQQQQQQQRVDRDGKISTQFSNYLTMTHTEARRVQSLTREEDDARAGHATLGTIRLALLKQQIWSVLSEPESSTLAAVVAFLVLGLIFVSTATFCLETIPVFERGPAAAVFLTIEYLAIAVFTAEYLLRLFSCPRKREFAKSLMNCIDLLSVLPFYIELALQSGTGGQTRFLRVIRLVRVFRVLKLGTRFQKFQIVRIALTESRDMMFLLAFLLLLSLIVFSTLMFFAERGTYVPSLGIYSRLNYDLACVSEGTDANGFLLTSCSPVASPFQSIPDTFWWCIVTLMTVGYGDVVPVTPAGKIVAAMTMIQAVLLLSLPISVIGTEFTQQWLEYRSLNTAVEKGRLAPRFVALRKSIHQHNTLLDDMLIRVRDQIFEMEDLSMRLADKLKQKKHELSTVLLAARTRGSLSLERDGQAERKRLENSAEIIHLERELKQRDETLKEILTHVQVLLDDDVARSMEHCRRSYFALKRLWNDSETLVGDVDDITEELDEALKEETLRKEADNRSVGGAGAGDSLRSPLAVAGSIIGTLVSFKAKPSLPRRGHSGHPENGSDAIIAEEGEESDDDEDEEKDKRSRPWMTLLSRKMEAKVVPIMVSEHPVHTVSAMKKKGSVSKGGSDADGGEGSTAGGSAAASAAAAEAAAAAGEAAAAAAGVPSSPTGAAGPFSDRDRVVSLRGNKSGRVAWTLPSYEEEDAGAPSRAPQSGAASPPGLV